MKTSELTGAALDWAVAKCETGQPLDRNGPFIVAFKYSTDWSQGGPIIERERIHISCWPTRADTRETNPNPWYAQEFRRGAVSHDDYFDPYKNDMSGPTPLIAAMRCVVASKLGDEVEIPEELL
jgi:hypothetical protein